MTSQPLTREQWLLSLPQAQAALGGWCRTDSFIRHGEIGQNRPPPERTLSHFRRPADQITLPEIAMFGDGKSFANQNTSHLGGIGLSLLYKLIDTGSIQRVKIGRRAFVTQASVDAFVASLTAA